MPEISSRRLPGGYLVETTPMPKLTKRIVDAASAAPGSGAFVWDTDVKGFGLRVKPSGVKSYVLKYRVGSRSRRGTIGKHGSPWTAETAREKAKEYLRQVADGHDPFAEKAAGRKAQTVAELAELYLGEGPAEKPNKKASSWAADRSNIIRHINPLLGRKLLPALTQSDVAKFQLDVARGKSADDVKTGKRGRAIVEGGPGTAARSLAVLGAMLQFAVNRKLLTANPAKGVKLLSTGRRERFLSEAEVARLAETLRAMEADNALSGTAAAAVRLLLLTGCRKSEILTLQWNWIDWERSCLRLPNSKTGPKVVPLAAAALAILSQLPRTSRFVLPAAMGLGHYDGLGKDWRRVREKASLPGVRVHDLRHSFASFAVANGQTLFMVGKILGHRQSRTTEVYAHLAADPLRAAADRTANRIAAAMNAHATPAEIIDLPTMRAKA